GGLVLFNRKTENFVTYTTAHELSNNTVKAIIEDLDHNLWLATNNGITEFSIYTRKATPYTLNDGLPAGSFFNTAKYRDEKGKIYFGMNEGYLIIDPALSVETRSFPKVVLTEFKIFNDAITPKSKDSPLSTNITEAREVHLSYDQNSLAFEFAGLNFSIPKHNFYAYKLEGFDEDWNYTGKSRMAKYTNLDPKHYVFKVRASNDEKVWQEYATSFDIYIDPPFWQTWWFRVLEVVLALTLIMALYYIRTRSIMEKNKWLKQQVSVRTKELQDTNKALSIQTETVLAQSSELLAQKHALELNNAKLEEYNQLQQKLIGIISHDIRGPIQRFSALLQLIDEQSRDFIIEKLKENAATLSLLTTDLLSWVRMQSSKEIEVFDFSWSEVWDKASREFDTFRAEKRIHFMVVHHDTGTVRGIPAITQAAIRNIISNAIKYSAVGGNIEIETGVLKDGHSTLRITDFGKGFDAEQINRLIGGEGLKGMKSVTLQEGAGLGMSICYDMIKRCGGWIEAKSLPCSGGTFLIYLPLGTTLP
ncbi:MAG TPA: ATP-binding protein, partial [Cytophagales bacterium]|nr:ATP-binding protein [Cytophagales bacterium]